MTKADLVDQVTAIGDLTRRDGEVIVDTLFDAVIGALKSGDKIEIRGFGSFRTRQRNARTGRNPKTGAKVDVPAKRVPFFKPSKELRDSVNPNGAAKSSREEVRYERRRSTSPASDVVDDKSKTERAGAVASARFVLLASCSLMVRGSGLAPNPPCLAERPARQVPPRTLPPTSPR